MNRFAMTARMTRSPADDGAGGGGGGDDAAATAAAAAAAAAAKPDDAAAAAAAGKTGDNPYKWFADEIAPEDKAYLETKSFKSSQDLLKSLRGAEKLIGGDKIAVPPDDATKHADWMKESGLAKRLGVPDEPTGYTVKPPAFSDEIKDHIAYDDERHGRVLAGAHKLNLTPAQVEGVLGLYASEMAADAQTYVTEAKNDEIAMQTTLKREWGDSYDVNVRAALEVAAEVGLDEVAVESLRLGKVAGSTALTKILHELAIARGNDTLKGGGKGGGPDGGVEQAQAQLDEFMAKNTDALTKRDHPEHGTAFARLQELKKAAGRGSKD